MAFYSSWCLRPGGTQAALETAEEDFEEDLGYGIIRPRRNRLLAEFAEYDRLRQLECRALERERIVVQKDVSAEMSSRFDYKMEAAERQIRELEDHIKWQAQRDLRHASAVPLPAGPSKATKRTKTYLAHEGREDLSFELAPEKERIRHIIDDAATSEKDVCTQKKSNSIDTSAQIATSPFSSQASAHDEAPQLHAHIGARQEQTQAHVRHDRHRRSRRDKPFDEMYAGLGRTQAAANDCQATYASGTKENKGQNTK